MTDRAKIAKGYFGVQHMDRLNSDSAIVIRLAADKSQKLSVLDLP